MTKTRNALGQFEKANTSDEFHHNGTVTANAEQRFSRACEDIVENAYQFRTDLYRKLFDPRRDIDDECGYPKTESEIIDTRKYQMLYDREAIATRVVEIFPRESWQVQPEVFEDEDMDTETDFEESWEELGKGLRGEHSHYVTDEGHPLWEYLLRADILSGIGRYGILLLGLDDGDLEQPVAGVEEENTVPVGEEDEQLGRPAFVGNSYRLTINQEATRGRKLLYVRPFPESLAVIDKYEANFTSPRFGQPVMYSVTLTDPGQAGANTGVGINHVTKKVHWTRVVHIIDNPSSGEVFGVPRMQSVLNRLLDLRKLYAGSAEMYWKGAFPGFSLEGGQDVSEATINRDKIKDSMENMMNGLQRYMIALGFTVKSLAPQVVDPTPQIMTQIDAICIKKGIPKRKFMGSERGELASSQDDGDWNDLLRNRQVNHVIPRLIVPVIDRLIMVGVLSEPEDGYRINWPDLAAQTEDEKATIAVKQTEAMSKYVGGDVESIMEPQDYLHRILKLDQDEVDAILEAVEEREEEEEKEKGDEPDIPFPPQLPFQQPPKVPPVPAVQNTKKIIRHGRDEEGFYSTIEEVTKE